MIGQLKERSPLGMILPYSPAPTISNKKEPEKGLHVILPTNFYHGFPTFRTTDCVSNVYLDVVDVYVR